MWWWILGAAVVALAVSALVDVFRNRDLSTGARAMWTIVVVLLPLLGSAVYFGVRRDW